MPLPIERAPTGRNHRPNGLEPNKKSSPSFLNVKHDLAIYISKPGTSMVSPKLAQRLYEEGEIFIPAIVPEAKTIVDVAPKAVSEEAVDKTTVEKIEEETGRKTKFTTEISYSYSFAEVAFLQDKMRKHLVRKMKERAKVKNETNCKTVPTKENKASLAWSTSSTGRMHGERIPSF